MKKDWGKEAYIAGLMTMCALMCPAATMAATLRVPSGYPTIQAAIDSSGFGDTIQVAAGTYREKLYVIGRPGIAITGAGRLQTLIVNRFNPENDRPALYVENSTGIAISGIGFKGGYTGLVITRDSSVTVGASSFTGYRMGGIFVGELPCAPLVTCSLRAPACYLADRQRYVDSSRLEVRNSIVADNGIRGLSGCGLAFFAGTTGLIQNSLVDRNQLTGLFVWGGQVDLEGNRFRGNVEHAVEYRIYPSPLSMDGLTLRAGGTLTGNRIRNSVTLPDGRLGGGIVAQGADLDLTGNRIEGNSTWGISAARNSHLTMLGNSIDGNGNAGLVVQRGSWAFVGAGNSLSGNGYEGLVTMGNATVEVADAEISNNGRYGVLFQNKTQGHLSGVLVSGNGAGGGYFGGVAFATRSWGSVRDSRIEGHANGPGIRYYGGPNELVVERNVISGNRRSGVVFDGPEAFGVVGGNTFSPRNIRYDVACPNGGSPSLLGQPGAIDGRCP